MKKLKANKMLPTYRLHRIVEMLTSQSAIDNYCRAVTDGRFDYPHARLVLLYCLKEVRCRLSFLKTSRFVDNTMIYLQREKLKQYVTHIDNFSCQNVVSYRV